MIPKGGMKNIIKKAQELQNQMEKVQEELNTIEIEGQSGGGMITAKVNGHKELITLSYKNVTTSFRTIIKCTKSKLLGRIIKK